MRKTSLTAALACVLVSSGAAVGCKNTNGNVTGPSQVVNVVGRWVSTLVVVDGVDSSSSPQELLLKQTADDGGQAFGTWINRNAGRCDWKSHFLTGTVSGSSVQLTAIAGDNGCKKNGILSYPFDLPLATVAENTMTMEGSLTTVVNGRERSASMKIVFRREIHTDQH